MQLAVIGAGYVGLVSGACFADFGHTVVCVDKDAEKVAALRRGEIPIFEPGLDALVANNMRQGQLSFTSDVTEAVRGAEAIFIAVGTPSRRGDGHADLSYVYAAAREAAAAAEGFVVIVTKSTVPVGTGDEVERIIREVNPHAEFEVVSNPEFLREGSAINDFKRPDRIVIGASDARARALMTEIYRPLNLNKPPLLFVDRRTSELIKYAANAFLATKITFINEIADLCEKVGAECAGRRARHRHGQPHRREISACRAGLRRLLLSEGHAGARQDRPGRRRADAHRRGGRRGQRSAQARDGEKGDRRLRRVGARQDDRRCSASPSNPIPTTCATRRRWRWRRRSKTPARGCGSSTPARWRRRSRA